MPTPRSCQVNLEATPYYHCISRCVRRAFLCGNDRLTGKSFDHRRQWLADRLRELSAIFAIDVCAYALMSNHFHVVLHVHRSRALRWSDSDVAFRYGQLFPQAVRAANALPEAARRAAVARWRARLADLSWFMRCVNESIARRANAEDGCRGRFWEGRFRSQALLDAGALVTAMAYVDLNPVRAGVARQLDECRWTSVRARLRESSGSACPSGLLPFQDQAGKTAMCLPVTFADYVAVLRWTAASLTDACTGDAAPEAVTATLASVGLARPGFVEGFRSFSRTFFSMVGHVHRIDLESRRRGYRRRPGIRAARRLYLPDAA